MAIFIKLLSYLKQVQKVFALGLVLLLVSTGLSQLAPLQLQALIDGPLTSLSLGQGISQLVFLQGLSAYLSMILLAGGLSYGARRILTYCANRIASLQRQEAYRVMQGLPIAYFDDKPAGKIATRIVNDTETLRNQFYGTLLSQIVVSLFQVVFIYGLLFRLNWRLGLLLLVMIPVFVLWQLLYHRLTTPHIKTFYEARSEVNNLVNETMHGAEILQAYGQEESMRQEFYQASDRMKTADNHLTRLYSLISWNLSEMIKYLTVAAVLTLVGYQFLAGASQVTPGRLFIYLNYLMHLFDLLGSLVRQLPTLQRSKETGERVLSLLSEPLEADAAELLSIDRGRVVFERVGFGYKPDQPVLTDISFEVGEGQTLALVGHTGSGKSSIMNLLYRFYDPEEGRILLDGKDTRHYSRESLRRQMGIVLQDPYLFTGTIASNVSMGKPDASEVEILAALDKVGASDMLTRLPLGLYEPVVEKGAAFSSGERQLIAFARTLLADPKILILDEATSHIDTETESLIQKAMAVVKEGRTTLIIAHRLSTIQDADQILVLEEGQIIERGRHEDLLALGGRYAQMHQIQQRVEV